MIREAEAKDRTRVVALLREAHKVGGLPFSFSVPHAAALFDSCLTAPDRVCLVAEGVQVDGCFVAIAADSLLGPVKIANEIAWWVDAGLRGRGAYQTMQDLISGFESWASSRGCILAGVGAMAASPRLGGVYQRLGYEPAETHFMKSLAPLAAA